MKARPYQDEIHHAVRAAIAAGHRAILVQSATGTGKTFIGARFIIGATTKRNRSLALAPRRELVYQLAERLRYFEVEPGIIMAGEPMHIDRLAQVASFDTLHARAVRSAAIDMPYAKVVLVDEAHLSVAETRKEILDLFPGAVIIGLTATPARPNGRPLKLVYDHLVLGWPISKMIEEGYLVATRYFAPTEPDLKAVKKNKDGDYSEKGLEKVMNTPTIVGDILENWQRLASDMQTVVFCVTRKHAKFVCEQFQKAGVAAEYVDGDTPSDERKGIFDRVDRKQTQVLVNVFVASYGLDIPSLQCCVLARPTKSLVMYMQMIGRTLRPVYADGFDLDLREGRLDAIAHSDKPYAMVIDHSGAVRRHGFVDEPIPWTLDGDENVSEVKERQKAEGKEPKELVCPQCKAVVKGRRFCPSCGYEFVAPGAPLPVHGADLEEIARDGNEANRKTPWADKIRFMGEAKAYAASKGYTEGFAANMYREKFGVWPNDSRVRHAPPTPPTDLLKGFIKYRAIRRLKSAHA